MLITILPPQSTTNASLRLEHGKREEIRCESRSNFLLFVFPRCQKISVLCPFGLYPGSSVQPYCACSVKPTNNEFVSRGGGTPTSQNPIPGAENPPFAIGIELSDSDSCYPVKLTCLFTEKQRRCSRRTPLPPRAPSALRAPSPPRFSSRPASRPLRPGSARN